jgi:hypothetical protein
VYVAVLLEVVATPEISPLVASRKRAITELAVSPIHQKSQK